MDEELLAVWLRLTSVIDNQRLAAANAGGKALPFNEAMVCGLLARAKEENGFLTASSLCRHTRILKSQMNVILRSLEDKGAIERRQSENDRRQMELRLLPEGERLYQESHQRVKKLVGRVIGEMGEGQVQILLPLLRQAADIFDAMQQEVS